MQLGKFNEFIRFMSLKLCSQSSSNIRKTYCVRLTRFSCTGQKQKLSDSYILCIITRKLLCILPYWALWKYESFNGCNKSSKNNQYTAFIKLKSFKIPEYVDGTLWSDNEELHYYSKKWNLTYMRKKYKIFADLSFLACMKVSTKMKEVSQVLVFGTGIRQMVISGVSAKKLEWINQISG